MALTNDAGASQTTYTYEPFGSATQAGTASSNAFQYTGRENDGTGLYYYRARYYSPIYQRFVREDPVAYPTGDQFLNSYVYTADNPTTFIDPIGLWRVSGQGKIPPAVPSTQLWPFLDCRDLCARNNAAPGQDPAWIQWTVTRTYLKIFLPFVRGGWEGQSPGQELLRMSAEHRHGGRPALRPPLPLLTKEGSRQSIVMPEA